MADLKKLIEDLSIVETNNDLPKKLKTTLKQLKHGLGDLIKEEFPPLVKAFDDHLTEGSIITGFDYDDETIRVFVDLTKDNGKVEKQAWKLGTNDQLEKDLLSSWEDDETLGFFNFENIMNHCDKFNHLNVRERNALVKAMDEIDNWAKSLLYKALMSKDNLKKLLDYCVGMDGWANTYCTGYNETDSFEFEGEEYFYFRVD